MSQLVRVKLEDIEKILAQIKNSNKDILDRSLSSNDDEDYMNYGDGEDPRSNDALKMLKMDLEKIDQQTLESKRELEQWRQEAKQLENLLKRPNTNMELLSEIQSDVISRRDESVRINSVNANFSSMECPLSQETLQKWTETTSLTIG